MSTDTGLRYPRAAIAAVIESAMAGADYAHTAEWTAPESCPCLREGVTCLAIQALRGVSACQGYTAHIPLPPGKSITADDLIAVLPEPDAQGLVSASAAANALGALASSRMSWCPYRNMTLFDRLGTALDDFEAALRSAAGISASSAGLPRCQVCAQPLKPGSKPSRRTCGDNCRQKLRQRRLRASRQAPGSREGVTGPGISAG